MAQCPGSCGLEISDRQFACLTCLERLPVDRRRSLASRHRLDTAARMFSEHNALSWFRCNPPRRSRKNLDVAAVTPDQQRELFAALGGDPSTWDTEQRERRQVN